MPTRKITIRRPDPEVWETALEYAGGDARRLEVTEDGAVIVHNLPKHRRPAPMNRGGSSAG